MVLGPTGWDTEVVEETESVLENRKSPSKLEADPVHVSTAFVL
jgi:hypothetical protein